MPVVVFYRHSEQPGGEKSWFIGKRYDELGVFIADGQHIEKVRSRTFVLVTWAALHPREYRIALSLSLSLSPLVAPFFPLSSSKNNKNYFLFNMLRRKPTAITITSEDVAAFEEARLRQLEENKHPDHGKGSSNTAFDPSDELKPLPGDKARIVRSREERIGLGRRG